MSAGNASATLPWSPFVLLLISLGVSALGYVQLDNRQQEIRIAILEKEIHFWQDQSQKRLDILSQRLLTLGLRQDKYFPRTGTYEEDGP